MEKETIIAKMKMEIGFTKETINYFNHFKSGSEGSLPLIVRDNGNQYLLEFSSSWNSIFIEECTHEYTLFFDEIGIDKEYLPSVKILESNVGSWIIEAALIIASSVGSAYVILEGISKIPEIIDGLKDLKDRIKNQYERRVKEKIVSDINDTIIDKDKVSISINFSIDARPLLTLIADGIRSQTKDMIIENEKVKKELAKENALNDLEKMINCLLKPKKLKEDPFYQFMKTNEEFGDGDINHTKEVVEYEDKLFKEEELHKYFDEAYPPAIRAQLSIIESFNTITKSHHGERKRLINVALWHDLGKGILRARHAMEGADYILELNSSDRQKLQDQLQINEKNLELIADLIRFHDYFGVLATGEASPLLFYDVLYPVSNRSIFSNDDFINLLLLINIADARSSIKNKLLPYEKAEIYLDDLDDFNQINNTLNDPERRQHQEVLEILKKKSIAETQERLRRLLREGVLKYMNNENTVNKTGQKKIVAGWFIKRDLDEINWAFNVSNLNLHFFEQFALTCRLDYGLGFITALVANIIKNFDDKGSLKEKNNSSIFSEVKRECAVIVLEILSKLVSRYGDLTKGDKRMGLEMQFLGKQRQQVGDRTRVGTEALINKILSYKSTKRTESINKVVNETLAWII